MRGGGQVGVGFGRVRHVRFSSGWSGVLAADGLSIPISSHGAREKEQHNDLFFRTP
jgi:hypothetical protein